MVIIIFRELEKVPAHQPCDQRTNTKKDGGWCAENNVLSAPVKLLTHFLYKSEILGGKTLQHTKFVDFDKYLLLYLDNLPIYI